MRINEHLPWIYHGPRTRCRLKSGEFNVKLIHNPEVLLGRAPTCCAENHFKLMKSVVLRNTLKAFMDMCIMPYGRHIFSNPYRKKGSIISPIILVELWRRPKTNLVICEKRFSFGFRIHMDILPPMRIHMYVLFSGIRCCTRVTTRYSLFSRRSKAQGFLALLIFYNFTFNTFDYLSS